MLSALKNTFRLTRAGATLAWHGAAFVPHSVSLPAPLRALRGSFREEERGCNARSERLFRAIRALGPSYIKLGQFLATRPDVVGPQLAGALGGLRDKLPPFPLSEAKSEIEKAFGKCWDEVYAELGPPTAAASIAQVHKAVVCEEGKLRAVAVKILRPGIEKRFERDLESFYFAAHTAERLSPKTRRLRPVAAVDTLARSVLIETDLRLEAAAISEMGENIAKAGDVGFRVPRVDWERTARRILTLDWVEGIPLADLEAIDAAGLNREALGLTLIRSFLRHAIRDGFFHADMHQGNLFADPRDAALIAVDFGIMGRLGPRERRFLAEILYGFVTRNYDRIAEVHFEAGYVPASQDVRAFSQALRAIGEPIMGRIAADISMARLLTQLFEMTELFEMRMRPELLLLQKTMVVVEGVARSLDPRINIWIAAEPVVRQWLADQLGPDAKLRDALATVGELASKLKQAPQLIERGTRLMETLDAQAKAIDAPSSGRHRRLAVVLPLWAGAMALIVIAVKLLLG